MLTSGYCILCFKFHDFVWLLILGLKRKRNPEVFCCRWKLVHLVDNMFLLRRQGQNQLENDSSKQDTKVYLFVNSEAPYQISKNPKEEF